MRHPAWTIRPLLLRWQFYDDCAGQMDWHFERFVERQIRGEPTTVYCEQERCPTRQLSADPEAGGGEHGENGEHWETVVHQQQHLSQRSGQQTELSSQLNSQSQQLDQLRLMVSDNQQTIVHAQSLLQRHPPGMIVILNIKTILQSVYKMPEFRVKRLIFYSTESEYSKYSSVVRML